MLGLVRYASEILTGAFLLLAGSSIAHAVSCPDTPWDRPVIDVPPGKSVRIMWFRGRAEASYLEICESHGQSMELLPGSGESVPQGVWVQLPSGPRPPEKSYYYLKAYAERLWGEKHEPWAGMRRVDTPWGATFNWFDKTSDGYNPNTIVEFCIFSRIEECPKH